MFLRFRPSPLEIHAFIESSHTQPLSYEPVGIARTGCAGFQLDHQETIIGRGRTALERAMAALTEWEHFHLGWVEVFPARPAIAPGTVIAVLAQHLGFWSLNGCRVVYTIGQSNTDEFGFAYGTLDDHAERGEEIFKLSMRQDTGDVVYTIRAVSQPRALLARIGFPIARSFQRRFRHDSAAELARRLAKEP